MEALPFYIPVRIKYNNYDLSPLLAYSILILYGV